MNTKINDNDAVERAAMLGMSAWVTEVVAATTSGGVAQRLYHVGFKGIDLALGEGETWEWAIARAMDLIFRA